MRILVGITGGIAAFKAVALVRILTEAGHEVKVVPTANALRFVGKTTLEALSKNTVDSDLFNDVADVKHIELAKWAEAIVVAPATASFLARTAAGIADDLLSNIVLAGTAPILLAPAMHTEMWENAATQANLSTLGQRGFSILEPAIGRLTGEDSGKGRLPEPEVIAEAALALIKPKDLAGLAVLVTAGGTREKIDPVRFIGNSSSGKQGTEIAKEAWSRGAHVTLVAANFEPVVPFEVISVSSTEELAATLRSRSQVDVLVMAAAVSDYRVETPSNTKIKKADSGANLEIKLVQNEDLLSQYASQKSNGQTVVGFAAETIGDPKLLEAEALKKLERKNCDLLVANDVSDGKVFDRDENNVLIVSRARAPQQASGSKRQVAEAVIDAVVLFRK